MNETCMKHALNMPDISACPYCEIDRLKAELEQTRVQLAGCGVAAMCNTRESMQQQLCRKGDYGYSASYQDVIDAVNREIALREENDALREEVGRLKEIGNRRLMHCNQCGSDLIVDICSAGKSIHTTDIRKHTARECVTIIETKCNQWLEKHRLDTSWQSLAANEIRQRFGLEG